MAKGDKIIVVLRGVENPIIVEALKAGRTLHEDSEKDLGVQWILIHEMTWTGKTTKTTRFAAADVVAMIKDVKEE